ncbi:MAG: protease inhibitor Inh/omp19 family protein [Siculibacillus sp.]|nr:protease inhibitor Inh/omp19 family protein [Siculibacillus sp.]
MIRADRVALALLLAGTVAGCGRLGLNDGPTVPRYEPLPAAPTAPVTQGTLQPLPPAPGAPGATQPLDPNAPPPVAAPGAPPPSAAPTKVAEAAPDKGQPVGRTDLLGGWRVASGSDNCQLFMNLTSWAGGYRAISKGCTSPELARISAWDLQGRQVTLKGADGGVVATLNSQGGERFAGTTASKLPISLSR